VKKLYANFIGKNKPSRGPHFDLFCRRSRHLSAIAPHLCTFTRADAKAPFFKAEMPSANVTVSRQAWFF